MRLWLLFPFFLFLTQCQSSPKVRSCRGRLPATRAGACRAVFGPHSFQVSSETFQGIYDRTRGALLGANPATVKRSEWKASVKRQDVVNFLQKLTDRFGGSFSMPARGPFINQLLRSFEQTLERGMRLRNGSPVSGATDFTMTFYPKKILTTNAGRAKHQFRFRVYLRRVDPFSIKIGTPVIGYKDGNTVEIQRFKLDQFRVTVSDPSGVRLSRSLSMTMTGQQVAQEFGVLFAPHGQQVGMEIKTRLEEEIQAPEVLSQLSGANFVEKPIVKIEIPDFFFLFQKEGDFAEKIKTLKEKYLGQAKTAGVDPTPTQAFLDVLLEVYALDSSFFELDGAASYQRAAFAIPEIGFTDDGVPLESQITIDAAIALHGVYNEEGQLLSPEEVFSQDPPLATMNDYQVEVKVPKVLLADFEEVEQNPRLIFLLRLFHNLNISNTGKFRSLLKEYEEEP